MEPMDKSPAKADEVVDELMPPELNWQHLVRRYPLAAVGLAAVGGFVLGRTRGSEILAAISGFAADSVTRQINELFGEEIL